MKKKVNCEVFMTSEQFNKLVENSTIVIHSMTPDSCVEILSKFTDEQKADLGRIIEESIKQPKEMIQIIDSKGKVVKEYEKTGGKYAKTKRA